jgi:hypothetical protein
VFDFTETERAAIAELASPYAELMARVHRCIRQHFGRPLTRRVAAEQFGEARNVAKLRRETEQCCGLRGEADHVRRAKRRGGQTCEKRAAELRERARRGSDKSVGKIR